MKVSEAATRVILRPEPPWLNRNVLGMGIASLLSDASHEMATAVLPGFLAVLGLPAAALGFIEGAADSISSAAKLCSGWLSDRSGRRKPLAVEGYFLTGFSKALFAFAHGWPLVLVGRVLGWFGRGIRGPLRDALLAESVPAESRGKAFGFHRTGDTLGAIIGPVVSVWLIAHYHSRSQDPAAPFRKIFLLTLIPGIASALAFASFVKEEPGAPARIQFWASVKSLPTSYRRFLVGCGIFGLGDYARTMIILAATQILSPRYGLTAAAQSAAMFYVGHNIFYAGYSYPIGALSDRVGRRGLLAGGYLAGALSSLGFVAAFVWKLNVAVYLLAMFGLAGFSMAVEDSLEGAMTADLVQVELRGTAYGVLGTINGIGDLVSSGMVGILWTLFSPIAAFFYATVLMALGALVIFYWSPQE